MEIICELENMSAIGFTGSLHKLKLALEVADAYARNLQNGMDLSDEFTYVGNTIKLIVVPRGRTEVVDTTTVSLIDQRVVASLSACIDRRTRANEQNMPAVALPTDPKHLLLNKTVHAAVAAGVLPNIAGHDGQMQRVKAVEPRDTTLIEPPPEPVEIEGDYLISRSNVVGIHQPDLFDDTNVDIVLFLHGTNFEEIRFRGPLHLAAVANMTTRVRGTFNRNHPRDRHLTCEGRPEVYSVGQNAIV